MARHHLCNLAGLEVGNFDLPALHVHTGGFVAKVTMNWVPHDCGEIRRLDFEVLDVLLLDIKQD
ncbi:hypothetical protein [Bradyrhizobium arachidis]|uniref:hypothetical protein n=1 Tax=Bradyrhizobium arachidis TaxID=858423 RepID=UPI00142E3A73|nr:hypothetical protein [Bradyrhizobium arachidis]